MAALSHCWAPAHDFGVRNTQGVAPAIRDGNVPPLLPLAMSSAAPWGWSRARRQLNASIDTRGKKKNVDGFETPDTAPGPLPQPITQLRPRSRRPGLRLHFVSPITASCVFPPQVFQPCLPRHFIHHPEPGCQPRSPRRRCWFWKRGLAALSLGGRQKTLKPAPGRDRLGDKA